MKTGLFIFCLSSLGWATQSDPRLVEDALRNATLRADVEILETKTSADTLFGAKTLSKVQVLQVLAVQDDGESLPRAGDLLTIETLGGQVKDLGVMYAGLPYPSVGEKYRASLTRIQDETFKIAGMESGFTPLTRRRGYSRNRTDGSNGAGSGPFLYWDKTYFPVPYYISMPSFLAVPGIVGAVDASFRPWRDPGNVTLEFLPMGCTSTTLNRNDGMNSVIFASEDWPFEPAAIAVTRNFFVAGSGARAGLILDTDILINGADHEFTVSGEAGKHDVRNILTHEVGHFIGLGHEVPTKDADATMFESASTGETTKRDLHENDLRGLYAAYGGVGTKLTPISSEDSCQLATQTLSCLTSRRSGPTKSGFWWVAMSLACALLWGRWVQNRQ